MRHRLRVGRTLGESSAWVGTRNAEGLPDLRAHDDTASDLGIQSLEAVVRAPDRAALTDFRSRRSQGFPRHRCRTGLRARR
jgi:hypothetical protein